MKRLFAIALTCMLPFALSACSAAPVESSSPSQSPSESPSPSETPSIAPEIDTKNVRLAAVLKKAQRGEPVTIVALGDSITAGSLAGGNKGYVDMMRAWWEEKFPDNKRINIINAGIGGTTSQLGVYRTDRDALSHKPDLVIVEFINDTDSAVYKEAYEGIFRKLLGFGCAAISFEMMEYNSGRTPSKAHDPVVEEYGVPQISVKDELWDKLKSGELKAADITPDNLHPNDAGHRLLSDMLTGYLDGVLADLDSFPEVEYAELPIPITENRYYTAQIYDDMKWHGEKAGDTVTFEVSGGMVMLEYYKSPQVDNWADVEVVIDGGEPVTVSGKFPNGWGKADELKMLTEEGGEHTITITLVDDGNFDVIALMSSKLL
ncbi:hypothetical protein FACS1894202_02950 [Clostridia bacterium]|nr:hypothetical protein FACS1894202_02950 [Clostridia bacterium]